jgi:hypothetical protein
MKTVALILGVGVLAGCVYGDERRRRMHAELDAQDLNRLLGNLVVNKNQSTTSSAPDPQLKKIAAILGDAHKHIHAVSKALLEPAR